ncbi:replication-relaxation family protein [Alkalihalobacterium alkalinitrilicum]|uniref:replication-relaxation family protein n=1 Tax=Alkalihalobacterium alkalinitrilicum TaxID=427920 RepID=UPI000995C2A5|nr:replication-relaxation family protein [Alkalihalobacterium alkalinitrilicum]
MRKRDKVIIEDLQRFRCMSRDDILDLHFNHLKYPVPAANNVLKRLRLQGHVTANTKQQPYIYFTDPSPIKTDSQKIPHFLAILDFYKQVRKYAEPSIFTIEPKYGKGYMEPDIFMIWKGAPFFVEIQKSVYSKSVMGAKMQRYEDFYNSREWESEPWQGEKKYFPNVWFITDTRYDVTSNHFRIFQSRTVQEFLQSLK